MIPLYTPEQIKQAEKQKIAAGTTAKEMIKEAGKALFDEIFPRIAADPAIRRIYVLCGSGNNGADGYELARLLRREGKSVTVFFVNTGARTEENLYFSRGLDARADFPDFENCDLVVEAIFGAGFRGSLPERAAEIVSALNASGARVISVDLPCGVDGANGRTGGTAVKADLTVGLSAPLIGAYLYPGAGYTGKRVQTHAALSLPDPAAEIFELLPLPARSARGHKGTFGTVAVAAGSKNMAGASYLAAKAAFACGAGLVKILCPEENRVILQTLLPEAVLFTYDENTPLRQIVKEVSSADAAVIGPGLGQGEKQRSIVQALLSECCLPAVLDADGLNLAAGGDLIANYRGKLVITPHPGEASRLLSRSVSSLTDDPLSALAALTALGADAAVFKDAHTLSGDGKRIYINPHANSGMATAGCGDVLSGILGAMLCLFPDALTAAAQAVRLHSLAGGRAAKKYGKRSMTASRVIEGLEEILKESEPEDASL